MLTNKLITNSRGLNHTPVELFDIISANVDAMQAWNQAVQSFLAQERQPETLSVTL